MNNSSEEKSERIIPECKKSPKTALRELKNNS